jgi:phage terminase large subunit-like protein
LTPARPEIKEAFVATSIHHALKRRLAKLEARVASLFHRDLACLDQLRADPSRFMSSAGLPPDPWQRQLLHAQADQIMLLCARQSGKSSVAAALALQAALLRPRAPVLLLSPSLRQSGELFRKVQALFQALGRPMGVLADNAQRLELANGSRILCLPGTEKTIRGFSGVSLLVIDEAARVPDALYYAVRPMLAVSQGRLVALSTPLGKRGWFHEEWHGPGPWQRIKILADQCPRITAAFLAEEQRALGDRWYRQEYLCSFEDAVGAVFSYEDIQRALQNNHTAWY